MAGAPGSEGGRSLGGPVTADVGRRYRVVGSVQGVGYRAFARRTAIALGLSGSARNLADGSVEVVVVGAVAAVLAFEGALRRGPPHGSVTGLSWDEVDPETISSNTFGIN